jgi:hypothetical protein
MDFDKIKKELGDKYPNIQFLDIVENEETPGAVSMKVRVGAKELAYLDKNSRISPLIDVCRQSSASAGNTSVVSRSPLSRTDLDNVESSVLNQTPQDLYQRSIDYYKVKDIYGTVIRTLSNFASNGFENDIDDDNIKGFFDNWCMDIGIDALVDQIFFDFFRVGLVRTYKVLGKYEPNINIYSDVVSTKEMSTKALAARKKRWSKAHLPIQYTILNPTLIEIAGSLLFNQSVVTIKAEALSDLRDMIKNESSLSPQQRDILRAVPRDMKDAAINNKPYPLDPSLVGEVDYRRQPYERYPMPRGISAFESIEYKDELRKADLSTLDGISNYILLITVGNDEFPVTNQAALENVAELFNTTSKSFNVVYNHTLQIKKIISPEIEQILGQDKYKQVNDDYTGALGVVRALIDGGGSVSAGAADLAMKSIISEIEYSRRMVRRWLYKEYRGVAEAMGFDRYPVVRFNDIELRDMIEMMRVIMGMIDRRMLSYETGIQSLGKDASTEMSRLAREKDLVLDGTLGIIGSPYNPKAMPPLANPTNVQVKQRSPKGTPSEGRPPGGSDVPQVPADKSNASLVKIQYLLDEVGTLSAEELSILLENLKQ